MGGFGRERRVTVSMGGRGWTARDCPGLPGIARDCPGLPGPQQAGEAVGEGCGRVGGVRVGEGAMPAG
jgi:hypothetical protein